MSMNLTTRTMLNRIRLFWNYMNAGPHQDFDRAYLCSMAPLSAGALRNNEEAEHTRADW